MSSWLLNDTCVGAYVSVCLPVCLSVAVCVAASNAAVLGVLSPAWTMVISLLLRRERFVWMKLVGILLCVGGAIVIMNPTDLEFGCVSASAHSLDIRSMS